MRKYLQPAWYVGHHVDLDAPVHGSFFLGDVVAQAPRAREAHGVDAVHVDAALGNKPVWKSNFGRPAIDASRRLVNFHTATNDLMASARAFDRP